MKPLIFTLLVTIVMPFSYVNAATQCEIYCRSAAETFCADKPSYEKADCIRDEMASCPTDCVDAPPASAPQPGDVNPLPQSGTNGAGPPLPGAGAGTGTANPESIKIDNPLGIEDVMGLINKIGGVLIDLAIPIAVIMIIWSGVQFLIAGGNTEMIGKAKQTLWWSIIGLTVIFIGKGFITLIQSILSLKDG